MLKHRSSQHITQPHTVHRNMVHTPNTNHTHIQQHPTPTPTCAQGCKDGLAGVSGCGVGQLVQPAGGDQPTALNLGARGARQLLQLGWALCACTRKCISRIHTACSTTQRTRFEVVGDTPCPLNARCTPSPPPNRPHYPTINQQRTCLKAACTLARSCLAPAACSSLATLTTSHSSSTLRSA